MMADQRPSTRWARLSLECVQRVRIRTKGRPASRRQSEAEAVIADYYLKAKRQGFLGDLTEWTAIVGKSAEDLRGMLSKTPAPMGQEETDEKKAQDRSTDH